VIDVYSVADSVQDLVQQKSAYKKAIAKTGERGWVHDALKLVGKPGGDLKALALKMKERLGSSAA
jgi:hypothetical protein